MQRVLGKSNAELVFVSHPMLPLAETQPARISYRPLWSLPVVVSALVARSLDVTCDRADDPNPNTADSSSPVSVCEPNGYLKAV